MTNKELWKTILGQVELNTSRAHFATWFKNTSLVAKKNKTATIGVPNGFTKEWLQNKYTLLLLRTFQNITPEIKKIEYAIETASSPGKSLPPQKSKREENTALVENLHQLKLEVPKIDSTTNLNLKYTFESYVIGSSNELAHAASWSISQNPGAMYNPLFLYGGVGLGKTHLLQAIGNEVKKRTPKRTVRYISSEKFTTELISSIRDKTIEDFKNRYRKIDVLIIDDIQFLAGKEKTQEEFFHIFNALYEKNKQIVLSSDRPPKSIATLEERLRSRFEGGMIADIGYPDLETRIAILKMKAQERKLSCTDEVLEYIASNIQTNIRELEGALNRLVMASSQYPPKTTLALEHAENVLGPMITKQRKTIHWKKILETVSAFYEIDEKDIIGAQRKKEFVMPRQIIMFLIRKETDASYPFIGTKLGGRDHTTVMHACKKIQQGLENNDSFLEELNSIKERLYNSV